ncbi:BTB/POZ domain-containing protein KCTD3 [Balamuthia mandrillaris]
MQASSSGSSASSSAAPPPPPPPTIDTNQFWRELERRTAGQSSVFEEEWQKFQAEREQLRQERQLFEQTTQKLENAQCSAPIKLDVGGQVFKTSLRNLLKEPHSFFAVMFSGAWTAQADENGCYFIDRDPKHFRVILNYLRTGEVVLPQDPEAVAELLKEVEFYQLSSLWQEIESQRHNNKKAQAEQTPTEAYPRIVWSSFSTIPSNNNQTLSSNGGWANAYGPPLPSEKPVPYWMFQVDRNAGPGHICIGFGNTESINELVECGISCCIGKLEGSFSVVSGCTWEGYTGSSCKNPGHQCNGWQEGDKVGFIVQHDSLVFVHNQEMVFWFRPGLQWLAGWTPVISLHCPLDQCTLLTS